MSVINRDGNMRKRLCAVLTHPQRHGVLQTLRGGNALAVETVAERLVATDGGDGDAMADGRRVALRPHSMHLPKPAGVNATTDNRRGAAVTRSPNISPAYELVSQVAEAPVRPTESSRDDSGGD
ncbi:hypothetical protein SAMN04487948_104150 [Halogranum amylolyticum]|uniref:Uncharacterized protein n=1 Tax=Halogranum amylolyticum TaxID=660520 RepID=A0A1H8RPN6_9EURY|nr:hypothetical protein SAMN04487948_104150 [Halogranum amylolyticum]